MARKHVCRIDGWGLGSYVPVIWSSRGRAGRTNGRHPSAADIVGRTIYAPWPDLGRRRRRVLHLMVESYSFPGGTRGYLRIGCDGPCHRRGHKIPLERYDPSGDGPVYV
jgi:hypothetical protein